MLGRLTEQRAISFQTVWGSGADIEMLNPAGVNINQKTAFEIVAFFSAVSLISDTISTLPVDCLYRQDGEIYPFRPRPTWVDQPDVDNTRQAHYQQVLVSLMTDGNSFTRVFRDRGGEIVNLVVLDPQTVEIKRNGLGRKMFIVTGEKEPLSSNEIVHITDLLEPGALRGVSRVTKLNNALGVASALQQYAATFFGQGATTSGVIEFPGALLTAEQAKTLQDGFDSRHKGWRKAHKTGILSGGATYKQTSVPNDSAQFLESRRFAVEEIARAFNIPLHLLGVPDTASYASVEQNAIQFVTHTLRPYVEKLEWAYTRLLPNPAYLKFNVNGLMRGDFQTRIQSYSVGSQAGFLSVNDIRRMEDMRSVVGGDAYRVPLANVNLTAADLPEREGKVAMATKLINAGFDPAATLAALGLPEILHDGGVPTTIQPMTTTPGE
jgi:HK97 family phage portal protein